MNNLAEKRSAMLAMSEDWRSRDKTKKQYCLDKGINEVKFYYWYARVNETERSKAVFIPIQKASSTSEIEVIYPNGVKLKVNNDLLLLSQLIGLY